jgi:hypothetical protein
MAGGNRVAAPPFTDGFGRDAGKGCGGFLAAEAVDKIGDGNRHGHGVLEFCSGFN